MAVAGDGWSVRLEPSPRLRDAEKLLHQDGAGAVSEIAGRAVPCADPADHPQHEHSRHRVRLRPAGGPPRLRVELAARHALKLYRSSLAFVQQALPAGA